MMETTALTIFTVAGLAICALVAGHIYVDWSIERAAKHRRSIARKNRQKDGAS